MFVSNPYPLWTRNQRESQVNARVEKISFGEKILQLRESRGITQKQLGNLVGVSDRTIGYFESGRFPKDPYILNRFAEVFNVTIAYLLGYYPNETTLMKAIREEVQAFVKQQACGLLPAQIENVVNYVLHDECLWEKFNYSMAFCIEEMLEERAVKQLILPEVI